MSVKIVIISFFLIIFTIMLIIWINSIPVDQVRRSTNPASSGQIERIKVEPTSFPQKTTEPDPQSDEVLGAASPSASTKKLCQNKCGDEICQLVVCQGSACPCVESDVICPQDCR